LTWKNDLANNLGFLHEEGTVQIRNRKGNQSTNIEDINEKDKLDLHAEKSENKCSLPKREKNKKLRFLWN
jgi:hypothetical protein